MKYIATISGGKDSVTMCDLLLKNGYPVDEIIFTDTLEEFNEMYIYIEKLKDYFKTRYGKEITVLKPKSTFEDWAYGTIEKDGAKRKGMIRGIPTKDGMCYWRREAKIYPIERYLKRKELLRKASFNKDEGVFKDEKYTQYIGYTKGEDRSVQNTDTFTFSYPLQDTFNMTEEDCKAYLINQEMENPLYKHFSRTGCAMCPFQSDRSWYEVYSNYPEVWEKMKEREAHLQKLEDEGVKIINKYWFMGNKTIEDMELEFSMKSKSLFDFSDEPLKNCFCKI
jgi:3'-phosphoadenosine 5'-phosphosulfate sulfotransferase (PAPS reductase)/FAD synthetase